MRMRRRDEERKDADEREQMSNAKRRSRPDKMAKDKMVANAVLLKDGAEVVVRGVRYRVGVDMVRQLGYAPTLAGLSLLAGAVVASVLSRTGRVVVLSLAGGLAATTTIVVAAMASSKTVSDTMVSWILPVFMKYVIDRAQHRVKEELLKDIRGDVLDFGAGDGNHLAYIAECAANVDSVVSLEPMSKMHPDIRRNADKAGIAVDIFGGFSSDLLAQRGGEQFDFIIVGNVLCEVPEQEPIIRDLHALLKPSGVVYFLEHVAHEKGTLANLLEDLLNPLWVVASGGCNCNRRTLANVQACAPWTVHAWELPNPSHLCRMHCGLAVKDPPPALSAAATGAAAAR